MKTYQIDEELVSEIIEVLAKRRDELTLTTLHSNYIEWQRGQSMKLIRKLRSLEKVKHFIFQIGIKS